MKISYAITVKDELAEIRKLLHVLGIYSRINDEIVVLFDSKNGTSEVIDCIKAYFSENVVPFQSLLNTKSVNLQTDSSFNNDFAAWKNKLNSYCTGDYIFNIDADEIPSESLIKDLPFILSNNDFDAYQVPRVNIVNGITLDYITKCNWYIGKSTKFIKTIGSNDVVSPELLEVLEKYKLFIRQHFQVTTPGSQYYIPLINWNGDHQTRIYKNDKSIYWQNRVHEKLVGTENICMLPEEYYLLHEKSLERQIKQNNLYSTIS